VIDFLDIDETPPAPAPEEPSWLEIGSIEAPKASLPYDSLRFQCMRGSGRVWACDGRYVAYRPFNHTLDKVANPVFQERIERFNREGHFTHIGTFDEVMVFKLKPESPWYAYEDKAYVAGKSLWGDIAHAVKLACARDWRDYTDLLEAMAAGMLAGREPAFARKQWEDALNQVMIGIYQKGGPLAVEIAAGVENVRLSRGTSRSPRIVLATDIAAAKNVQYEGKT
jgi:hypothetical protein